jgi:hypothetical protein
MCLIPVKGVRCVNWIQRRQRKLFREDRKSDWSDSMLYAGIDEDDVSGHHCLQHITQ